MKYILLCEIPVLIAQVLIQVASELSGKQGYLCFIDLTSNNMTQSQQANLDFDPYHPPLPEYSFFNLDYLLLLKMQHCHPGMCIR